MIKKRSSDPINKTNALDISGKGQSEASNLPWYIHVVHSELCGQCAVCK